MVDVGGEQSSPAAVHRIQAVALGQKMLQGSLPHSVASGPNTEAAPASIAAA
jgi:hypothetical protein